MRRRKRKDDGGAWHGNLCSAEWADGNHDTVLKGCQELASCEILERLEPELKIFRFEKSDAFFETLSEEQQKEERMNIRNGMNFARKVLSTGECDLVILDEVLGLLDQGIIEMDEMKTLLQSRVEEIDLILTGKVFPKELDPFVDGIREIDHLKVDNTKQ